MSWGRVSSSDRLHRADQRTGSEHTLSCFLPCRSGIVAFGSASGATGSRTRTSQSAERVSLPAVGACAAPLSTGPVSRQVEPAISTLEAELSKTQRPRGGSQAQPARLERPMTSPEVERAALRAYAECEVDQRALESCVSWFSARRYAVSVTGPTGHGGHEKSPMSLVTPGFGRPKVQPSVTSAKDARAAHLPNHRPCALGIAARR